MAEDRKARLAALAARAGRSSTDAERGGSAPFSSDTAPAVRFRNYAPKDASLDGEQAASVAGPMAKRQRTGETSATPSSTSTAPATAKRAKQTSALEEAMKQAKAEASALTGSGGEESLTAPGINLASMAPKKVNWDLKRDIKGKLDKLERRTQRALVDLLKERLEKEADNDGYDGLD